MQKTFILSYILVIFSFICVSKTINAQEVLAFTCKNIGFDQALSNIPNAFCISPYYAKKVRSTIKDAFSLIQGLKLPAHIKTVPLEVKTLFKKMNIPNAIFLLSNKQTTLGNILIAWLQKRIHFITPLFLPVPYFWAYQNPEKTHLKSHAGLIKRIRISTNYQYRFMGLNWGGYMLSKKVTPIFPLSYHPGIYYHLYKLRTYIPLAGKIKGKQKYTLLPITSSRIGLIELTAGFFLQTRVFSISYKKKFSALLKKIFLASTLIHEARHSDGDTFDHNKDLDLFKNGGYGIEISWHRVLIALSKQSKTSALLKKEDIAFLKKYILPYFQKRISPRAIEKTSIHPKYLWNIKWVIRKNYLEYTKKNQKKVFFDVID